MKKSFKKSTIKTKKKTYNKDKEPQTPRIEGKEWKRQSKKYKGTKKRMKVLGALIIILLILVAVLGYVYFFKIDTDGDGLPDIIDDDDDNDGMPDWWEEHYDLDPKNSVDAEHDKDGDGLTNRNEYYFHSNPLIIDTDYDDLNDWEEWNVRKIYGRSTDPTNPDTDGDSMQDGWEIRYDLNPILNDAELDTDKDGYDANRNGILEREEYYTNLEEFGNKTNPKSRDSDNDGMWDGWEIYYRDKCSIIKRKFQQYNPTGKREYNHTFDPNDPADSNDDIDVIFNPDSTLRIAPDGLINLQEFLSETDPTKPDTDGDSLTDYEEIKVYKTDPLAWDTDCDGLWDGWEIKYGGKSVGLDPLSNDTDSNGMLDKYEDLDQDNLDNNIEHMLGTSPVLWDTDGDSISDCWEVFNSHNPLVHDGEFDTDNDLLSNRAEFENGTDPNNPDTDDDGLTDGEELAQGFCGVLINGIYFTNLDTTRYFTNATNNDTDHDGICDGEEIKNGMNASDPDTDHDRLSDLEEYKYGTDPTNQDTDDDRLNDWEEINKGEDGYITLPTDNDTDKDGLLDGYEVLTDFYPFTETKDGTNPTDPDTDGDGMSDGWEAHFGFAERNLSIIKNYDLQYGTDYSKKLQDNSYVPGVWLVNPLNPEDKDEDPDYDGYDENGDGIISKDEEFNNSEEFNLMPKFNLRPEDNYHTNPLTWDTDKDGMGDGWEFYFFRLEYVGPHPNLPDGDLDNDRDGIHYYVNRIRYENNFTNLEEYLMGEDLNNDGIIDHGTTDPNCLDTDRDGQNDYDEIWYGDDDGDGLWNGWELLFNGTPLDSGGYIPYKPMPGKFNPTKKNSDDVNESDKWEDYDGDGFSNIDEQGDIWHSPGSSDPTDQSMTPETIIISSRSVVSTNKENVITTYKFENELLLFFQLEISKKYIKNLYENNLLTKYITQMNNNNKSNYALSIATEKLKIYQGYLHVEIRN